MSDRRKKWIYSCLCFVFALGVYFWWIVFSVIAILIVIIGLLSIGIIYAYRTQDYEELPSDSVSPTDENTHPRIIGTSEEQQPVLESLPKIDEKSPDSQVPTPTPESLIEEDANASTKELQQRIAELEKRVQSLNEQLARDLLPSDVSTIAELEEYLAEEESQENFSEKAMRHLLETLDEKLAKRAISKQLYTRLRDKYIARREKAKKRREAPAKRGIKDSSTGD